MNKIELYNSMFTLPRHSFKEYDTRSASSISGIVIHCTDVFHSVNSTTQETAQHIYQLGKNAITPGPQNHLDSTGAPALPYHDIISPRGDIYRINPYELWTWHAAGHNKNNIGICLLYKTNNSYHLPTKNMYNSLYLMCAIYCLKYNIQPKNIYGHRELKGTGWIDRGGRKVQIKTCPGYEVDLDVVRFNIIKILQTKLKVNLDGIWGPKSEDALNNFYKRYSLSGYIPESTLFINMKGRSFDYTNFS